MTPLLAIEMLLLLGAVIIVWEHVFPAHPPHPEPGWYVRAMLINVLQMLVVLVINRFWMHGLNAHSVFSLGDQLSPFAGGAFAYFVFSFFVYVWHRAIHEYDWLWRNMHQLHHSPTRIQVLTAHYMQPLDAVALLLIGNAIVYWLLGLGAESAAWKVFITGSIGILIHANVRLPRVIGFVLQTPQMHRVHHRAEDNRKNYSPIVIWDVLFGTYLNPRTDEERHFGFDHAAELRVVDMMLGRRVEHPLDRDAADPTSMSHKTLNLGSRLLIRAIERLSGHNQLRRLYQEYRRTHEAAGSFWREAIEFAKVPIRLGEGSLQRIPASGPLLVVANHPFGFVDGMAVCWLVSKVRSDFKFIVSSRRTMPEMNNQVIEFDFSGSSDSMAKNLRARNEARNTLLEGGCVILFPAGGVSTSPDRFGRRPAVDSSWKPFVAQLVQTSKCATLPVWIAGQNSRFFQMVSHVHLILRWGLLPRENIRHMQRGFSMVVGQALPHDHVILAGHRDQMAAALRQATYALGGVDASAHGPSVAPQVKQPTGSRKNRDPESLHEQVQD